MNLKLHKIVDEILKEAMPHVLLKEKGGADLYFEFLEPKEKKEILKDLTSDDKPTIELPDFGQVGKYHIKNPAKTISKDDLLRGGEDFIKMFVDTKSPHPLLEYDETHHKYKLKPKYDLKKILDELEASS